MSERFDEGNVGVVPRTGNILVFQHDIKHEGSLLEGGIEWGTKEEDLDDEIDNNHVVIVKN